MHLAVGDFVVYGGHGTGHVIAREIRGRDGAGEEVVVLEFNDGLTVTLPIERALQQLRPLATELEIDGVCRTLRAAPPAKDEAWLHRRKATQAKLAAGATIGLAEVVRDGAYRETPVRGGTRLSVSERELYLKARRLLADEIGVARGVDRVDADNWIDLQLSHAER